MMIRSSFTRFLSIVLSTCIIAMCILPDNGIGASLPSEPSVAVQSILSIAQSDAGTHNSELEYAFMPTTLWTSLAVHLLSGNSMLCADLISIPGTDLSLGFGLTYNSLYNELDMGIGRGWMSNLHASAMLDPLNNTIHYITSTGTKLSFTFSPAEGKYLNPKGFAGLAKVLPSGEITITDLERNMLRFDSQGKMIRMEKCGKGSINVDYDVNSQATTITDPVSLRSIALEWSSTGKLLSAQDAMGHTWVFAYDENEEYLLSIQQPGFEESDPAITYFDYNTLGQLTGQTTFEGHKIEISYHDSGYASGKLSIWKDPAGNETAFSYEAVGPSYFKKAVITNAEGLITSYFAGQQSHQIEIIRQETPNEIIETIYSYDARGWMNHITDPAGYSYQIMRNTSGHMISLIYPPAIPGQPAYEREWIYDQDAVDGKLIQYREKITPLLWASTQFLYEDPAMDCLPTKLIDPDGVVTVMNYNSRGQLESATLDPENLNQSIHKAYASNGNLSSLIDPEGNETTYQYDANGQLQIETIFEGPSSLGQVQKINIIERHFSGSVTMSKDSVSGAQMTFSFNMDGAAACEYGYEECGKCYLYDTENQSSVYPVNYEKPWHNTDLSHPSRSPVMDIPRPPYKPPAVIVNFSNNEEMNYRLNKLGQAIEITNPLGQISTLEYDAFGRLSKATEFDGHTTSYAYNNRHQLSSKTIHGEGTWTYTRDSLGRIMQLQDPIKGQINYSYSLRGDILADENGNYSYDIKGRCVSAQYFGGGSDQWSYRADGALITHNGTPYEYNRLGLLTGWSDGMHQATIQYRTSLGLPLSLTGTGNISSYNFQYDARGRMSQVADTSKQLGFQYQWNSQNQLQSMILPGQLNLQMQYENKVPSSMSLSKNQITLYSGSSTFSNAQLRTGYTYSQAPSYQESYSFAYDQQQRLESLSYGSNQQSISYQYHADNGKTSKISFSDRGDYLIHRNPDGRVLSVQHPSQQLPEAYLYASDGKLSSISFPGSQTLEFSWDSRHRFTQIQVSENLTQSTYGFSYNALGKLSNISKSEQGFAAESWQFQYGPKGLEYATQSVYGFQHLSLNFSRDLLGRMIAVSYQQIGGFNGIMVPHFDLRGNLVLLTDPNGNLLASFQYDLANNRKINEWNPQQIYFPFEGFRGDFQIRLPLTGGADSIVLPVNGGWKIRTDWGIVNHEGDTDVPDENTTKPRYESFLGWDCLCDGWSEGKGQLTEGQRKTIEDELRRRGVKNKKELNDIIDEIEADINLCCTAETEDGKGGWKKGEHATLVFGTDGYFDWWIRCKIFPEKE